MLLHSGTFDRGVKIPGRKNLSSGKPVTVCPPPDKLYVCLAQHIGKIAQPLVKKGDYVKKGQLIGQADGFVSANIYSGVSGTVSAVTNLVTVGGVKPFVVIDNDFNYEEVTLDKIDVTDGAAVIARVKEAGIVGLGGAGFPTHVKLSPQNEVDVLLINCAECEPYLTCDARVMIELTNEVVEGAKIIAQALKVKRIIFGIEENKPECIAKISSYDGVEVKPLKAKYPQGGEKQLIYACTGRKVGLGKLPATTGVVVVNVQTVEKIYEATVLGRPLYDRVMTVTGDGVSEPCNLRVTVGTPYEKILEAAGGLKETAVRLIAGGPMMGKPLPGIVGYSTKTDSGLLALGKKYANLSSPTACINCARCASVCPMHLSPMYLDLYSCRGEWEKTDDYFVNACIECGSCAYVCPAKRDIVGSVRVAKANLRNMKR